MTKIHVQPTSDSSSTGQLENATSTVEPDIDLEDVQGQGEVQEAIVSTLLVNGKCDEFFFFFCNFMGKPHIHRFRGW